ncbi:hypothetical protein [Defluviimonas salinarum]|uniref:Uncharacterized protein n=1 Tax=Defluviimonas salinarum TaxID=2992147 RepID=A0ABT3J4Q7_9RHOB|nr:hypothetical protein [Defluviimonas salinarum]MCW3782455.1 hypothetical protein [Defluviimonas salinarum]
MKTILFSACVIGLASTALAEGGSSAVDGASRYFENVSASFARAGIVPDRAATDSAVYRDLVIASFARAGMVADDPAPAGGAQYYADLIAASFERAGMPVAGWMSRPGQDVVAAKHYNAQVDASFLRANMSPPRATSALSYLEAVDESFERAGMPVHIEITGMITALW